MTNYYLWERITGPDPSIRAADADRDGIAERLRKSHAEGRLDIGEFQERLERCYQAKTVGELSALVKDLPREDARLERRPSGLLAPWRLRLAPLAPILIGLIVISAVLGHHGFWVWMLLIFLLWRMSWWRRRRWHAGQRQRSGDWL